MVAEAPSGARTTYNIGSELITSVEHPEGYRTTYSYL
jgi:hypothetical protein